ncbi:MAG: hypothetical protein HQ579_01440, partial [Candidatus Omnitrophica bacterium]|nr:hypothetical protein [Candidatus Omnitrophota bacterium]
MSLPAMHTAVGMSVPFLIGLLRFLKTRRVTSLMLFIVAVFMIFCAMWAEIPDIPSFFSEKNMMLEHNIMKWKHVDIFFFHGLLDRYQSEDRGLFEGALLLLSMFFLMLFAASRTILSNEKRIASLSIKEPSGGHISFNKPANYEDIIDIHCHLLPEVDDGPETIEESIEMCRKMVDMGVKHVIATPHLPWREKYENNKILSSYELLKKRLSEEQINLNISLGSDNHITWDLIEKLRKGEVYPLANSRYFLLELDHYTIPPSLEDFITRCNKEEFYPIITHPERNMIFQSDISSLRKIAEMPALIQITSSSLLGYSGKKPKLAAIDALKSGLVDIIASDAHALNHRLKGFEEGLKVAEDIVGRESVQDMISRTPAMVINNDKIE